MTPNDFDPGPAYHAEQAERRRLSMLAYGSDSPMQTRTLAELREAAERKQGRPCPPPSSSKRDTAKPAAKPAKPSPIDEAAAAERAAWLAELDRKMGLA